MNEVDSAQREACARETRHAIVASLTVGAHRTFRLLFAIQLPVALLLAWKTGLPGDSRLIITLVVGIMLGVPALLFTRAAPLAWWVRQCVALAQVGWSILFMWLLEGRSEAHFHLFVSLVFLVYYRDWSVLVTATTAAIAYPILRISLLPESYLVGPAAVWHVFDQNIWVVCEALVLVFAMRTSDQTIKKFADANASLTLDNDKFRREADERTDELVRSREQYRLIAETTRAIPFELDLTRGVFTYVGPQAQTLLRFPVARWQEKGFLDALLPRDRENQIRRQFEENTSGTFEALSSVVTGDDRVVELRWTVSCELVKGNRYLRGLMFDVTEARRQLRESAQNQKLESMGRIAAGVAHEINTSTQFISDSVRFVRHALRDLPHALADYRALAADVLSGKDVTTAAKKASETDEAADVDYFLKNAPDALDRALEGIGRMASIVKSMTDFAHPDSDLQAEVDVNRAVRTTLNMARNEYRNVADLVTEFGDIPTVRCRAGDINQVVLNLLINASHAIGDAIKDSGERGRITVRTRTIGDFVEISISDTGDGIPESVRARIFEPFVTTKEVGRGTGQGLALSRGIVVEKLKGSLHFETETGRGTTFFVRLPVSETQKQAAA